MDRNLFETKLNMVRFGTEEELNKQWKECGADDSGWVNMEVSNRHKVISKKMIEHKFRYFVNYTKHK